jgi:hypothetical protein
MVTHPPRRAPRQCEWSTERQEVCSVRAGDQGLACSAAVGRRGAAGPVPVLRHGEPARGSGADAARSRPARAAGPRPDGSRRAPCREKRAGAPVPLPRLRRGDRRRAERHGSQVAFLGAGDCLGALALRGGQAIGSEGAFAGQPLVDGRSGRSGGLGHAAALGSRCSRPPALCARAALSARVVCAAGGGASGDDALCPRCAGRSLLAARPSSLARGAQRREGHRHVSRRARSSHQGRSLRSRCRLGHHLRRTLERRDDGDAQAQGPRRGGRAV